MNKQGTWGPDRCNPNLTNGQSPEFQTTNEMAEREPSIQGVCKDCGNGTLNNDLNPAFGISEDDDDLMTCLYCNSSHVDILTF